VARSILETTLWLTPARRARSTWRHRRRTRRTRTIAPKRWSFKRSSMAAAASPARIGNELAPSTTERLFDTMTWTTRPRSVHDPPTGRGHPPPSRGQPPHGTWMTPAAPWTRQTATSSGQPSARTTTSCVRGLTPDPFRSTLEPRAEPIRAPHAQPLPAMPAGPDHALGQPNGPLGPETPQLPDGSTERRRDGAHEPGNGQVWRRQATWPEPAARRSR
jgi:hypothetical protein